MSGLYVLGINVHGSVRGYDLELGRDMDTGGQTKYTVELSRALVKHPRVDRVDLVTRRIVDPVLGPSYAVEEEALSEHARIIRIAGGPDAYLQKEALWPFLDELAQNAL